MQKNQEGPRSLIRIMKLLEVMSSHGESITLAKLSLLLECPKSSLLALLRPLVAKGYLYHENNYYRLGPSIYRLAADIISSRNFSRLIRPFMEKLVLLTKESVYLAVIDRAGQCVSYVEGIESPQGVRYTAPLGSPRPLYCSAAGRLLLAYEDENWREQYIKNVLLKRLTEKTLTNRKILKNELLKITDEQIAVSLGEAVPGAAGLAAPIFDSNSKVIAALLIGAPINRFKKNLPELKKMIREVATQSSGILKS